MGETINQTGASIDLKDDYNKLENKIQSTKSYNDLKKQYKKASKNIGGSLDKFSDKSKSLSDKIDSISGKNKSFQQNVKNQFEKLLDINEVTGSKSIQYIKRKLILTVKDIEPKVNQILMDEILKAVGCDQQQTYIPNNPIFISVKSIDLGGILLINPTSKVGKLLYEKTDINIQNSPFSMNKQLYEIIQTGNPYSTFAGGDFYIGESKQDLMDIEYYDVNPITGVGGGWFKVTPKQRINNFVGQFLTDYYKTIKLFDNHNVYSWLMEFLTGAISIKLKMSDSQIEDKTKFKLLLQRMLGLCFDGRSEIEVGANSKISPSDGIDESFYEFSSIDLRYINQTVNNFKKGVIEFEDCDNVQIPVNTEGILNELDKLTYVKDDDVLNVANDLPSNIGDNNKTPNFNLPGVDIFDKEFLKNLINGLVTALLSPKVLLPIYAMIKAIGSTTNNAIDNINSFTGFCKYFKTFIINVTTKIGALFIKTLFNIIKKDLKNLIISVIQDITKEKIDKRTKLILKLTKILLTVAEVYKLIDDWRKCKSVVDELLNIIQIWTSKKLISQSTIPLPILFASRLLDGYSQTRAFIGTIEELQKIGIPTGAMPDGSPNLTVLSMYSQLTASANEENENGKVQVALGPLTITPSGFTVPANAFGKKL
jgi:hypothetical protein